ncbi:DUF986 family protein [Biostraticola tofi]|uniref:UPF0266 membrane protein EDC52_101330 n=1 Tax=Biostraticola tofi TaxID=466109 RepID=A0A4R3Z4K2_9GAMM|nr:DUF986 family protein [Biostraticola tofi]TCV99988.1 uncharacterized membrane protein YobD (UPF0266 family) [Biostraticola tofi]
MTITDIGVVICIAAGLLFAVYDVFIVDHFRQGETRLKVELKRQSRLDGLIFIGLIFILIYQNISSKGTVMTTTLLMILAFVAYYLSYIRRPKLVFKPQGFFFGNIFIRYERIQNMNLSEDGALVIDLEKRRLLIQVIEMDDLDKIYHFMIENQ